MDLILHFFFFISFMFSYDALNNKPFLRIPNSSVWYVEYWSIITKLSANFELLWNTMVWSQKRNYDFGWLSLLQTQELFGLIGLLCGQKTPRFSRNCNHSQLSLFFPKKNCTTNFGLDFRDSNMYIRQYVEWFKEFK